MALSYLTLNYIFLTVQQGLTLILTLISLASNNWLNYVASPPLSYQVTFGLYKKCTLLVPTCQSFPDPMLGDCDVPNFCNSWYFLRTLFVFSTVLVTINFLVLIYLTFFKSEWQLKTSKLVLASIGVFVLCSTVTTSLITYLNWTNLTFYVGTRFGLGYYLNLVASTLGLTTAAQLFSFNYLFRDNGYTEIE